MTFTHSSGGKQWERLLTCTSTGSRVPTLQLEQPRAEFTFLISLHHDIILISHISCTWCSKTKRKDATYNFQKGHLRTAWSTSQTPFWNIHFWIHQHLTEPSEPGELCAEHMRCHQAVQCQQSLQTFTAHPVHFSKKDWLLHVSQRVKQIKAQQFHSANYSVFY